MVAPKPGDRVYETTRKDFGGPVRKVFKVIESMPSDRFHVVLEEGGLHRVIGWDDVNAAWLIQGPHKDDPSEVQTR